MKKTIKIAHLYYDLMNLYGESGNVRAIKKFIERQGVDAEVHFLTLQDKIDFMEYDFYYIGCGTEANQALVLEDLKKYSEDIKKSVEAGKMYLATGNAMEMFGKKIRLLTGKSVECLGVFPYQAVENKERYVSELSFIYDKLPDKKGRDILGFKNCRCNIVLNDERLFEYASTFNRNNFYAMNFVGPFLVRNPYFTNKLVKDLFKEKDIPYKEITDTIEFKAYDEYVYNFITNSDLD